MSIWGSVAGAAIGVGGSMIASNNSGGGDSDIEASSLLTPEQYQTSNQLNQILQQQMGQGVTPYPGQRVAGINPLQQQGFGMAGGFGQGVGQGINAFGGAMGQFDPQRGGQFLDQAQGLLSSSTQDFDPQVIMDALRPGQQLAMNQFQQNTVPFLSEKFGANSGSSGSFNKALSEAGANMSLGMNAQAAPFLAQGQQNQLNRQLQGAALGGELSTVPGAIAQQGVGMGQGIFDILSQMINAGASQRGIEQEGLNANQQQFQEGQAYNNPWLNMFGPALGVSSENIVQLPSPGAGAAIGGAMGTLGSNEGFQQMIANLFNRNTTSGGTTDSGLQEQFES